MNMTRPQPLHAFRCVYVPAITCEQASGVCWGRRPARMSGTEAGGRVKCAEMVHFVIPIHHSSPLTPLTSYHLLDQIGQLPGQATVEAEVLAPVLDDICVAWSQLAHEHELQMVGVSVGGSCGEGRRPLLRLRSLPPFWMTSLCSAARGRGVVFCSQGGRAADGEVGLVRESRVGV